MSDDLNELLKGISAGRPDALEVLCKVYYRYVVSLLRWYKVPQESVEDLAQDVFFKFCQKVQDGGVNFKSEASLKAYLKRCAFTIWVDYVRKNKRAFILVDDPEESVQALDVQSRDNPELRAAVFEILEILSPEDREIIVMIDVKRMTHAEAARLRGVTPATSKNQLHDARKRFRELYRCRQDD